MQLGLDAEQVMLPVDHCSCSRGAGPSGPRDGPAAQRPDHFVVAWRRHGRIVQLMDPATGRRWPTCQRFLRELYVHTMPFPAAAWREWAGSEECLGALRRRLAQVGLSGRPMGLIEAALADPVGGPWRPSMPGRGWSRPRAAGGLGRGQQAARVLERYCEHARCGWASGEVTRGSRP